MLAVTFPKNEQESKQYYAGSKGMLIFWTKGLVMLSIPKTGTHSYIDHLQGNADIVFKHPQNLKHMGIRQFTNRILPLLPDKNKEIDYFGYVRNPVDWLWSWYSYRSRESIKMRPTYTGGMSFTDFIQAYLEKVQPPFANLGRQSGMLTSPHPPFKANRIFKYENQEKANKYLSDKLGFVVSPEKNLNKSPEMEKNISKSDIVLLENNIPLEFELYESAI